jgi:glycosyltransferase involved in cell wall biosynthesis
MNQQIEWIKSVMRLCMNEADTKEKKEAYGKLESEYFGFTEEEQNEVRHIMMTRLEARDRIYVLSAMIQNMKINAFEDDLWSSVLSENFDGCLGTALELQIMFYIKQGFYKNKRLLHRRNVDSFERELQFSRPYIPVAKRKKRRIVIITEQLLDIKHAPTREVYDFLYILQEQLHYEVRLFVCPSGDDERIEELWYRSVAFYENKEWNNKPLQTSYRGAVFSGYQVSLKQDWKKEYHMMLALIHAWNPYFVFSMGTRNPIIDLVGRFTTLAAMEMSNQCPVSEGKILLRLGVCTEEAVQENEEILHNNGQTQIFIEENFPLTKVNAAGKYTREELGLPEERFLIAIVGNRLDMEIDEEFAGVMRRIIEKVPKTFFVFIGKIQSAKAYFDREIFSDHVCFPGYQDDLSGFYECLDLYLNPKRAGGGFSSVMALTAGLPVVTLPDCDVASNVGEDFIVQDYEEMIETVCRYAKDKEFYAQKKQCAIVEAENNSDDKLVDYVSDVIHKIEEAIEEKEG